jgi:putative ABC transport system ATP-binding protein
LSDDPVLRLEAVSKTYAGAQDVAAVVEVSLELSPGELVLVMGPSGAGKTTLLQLCGALLRPSSGRVWVAGTEVSDLPEKRLPGLRLSKIGFVFQGFELLANLSALENVRLVLEAAGADRSKADERARSLLTGLGLGERLSSKPSMLSGGQKQRVAVARALANHPTLILADEPTGNLDSHTGAAVMQQLVAVAGERGTGVLCVTHDHRVIEYADRVVQIEDGRLTA